MIGALVQKYSSTNFNSSFLFIGSSRVFSLFIYNNSLFSLTFKSRVTKRSSFSFDIFSLGSSKILNINPNVSYNWALSLLHSMKADICSIAVPIFLSTCMVNKLHLITCTITWQQQKYINLSSSYLYFPYITF